MQTYWVDVAKKHVRNSIATFVPAVPSMEQCLGVVGPRHSDWCAALYHDHSIRPNFQHSLHELVRHGREMHVRAIEPLALPLAAQSDADDNLIRL